MKAFNFSSINLGCAKNLVDTQFVIGKILCDKDFEMNYFSDPFDSEVKYVFLNTCGFLSSARLEMFQNIKQLIKKNKKIIVFGCAVNFYKNIYDGDCERDIVEIFQDKNVLTVGYGDLSELKISGILNHFNAKQNLQKDDLKQALLLDGTRVYTNAHLGFEYLKIAEGCNNSCSFCLIPKIRGKQKSFEMERILEEVQNMISSGIKEIILIAQDTSRYGIDIYGKPMLFELLEKIDAVEGDFKYRLLYLYPDLLTLDSIQNFKNLKKFIPYFDMPFQHISPAILKSMRRFGDSDKIKEFIQKIKTVFPEVFLRTNIIVGFPGETQENFEDLQDFLKQAPFDNVSIFQFHDERFADSFKLTGKVDESTINQRFEKLKILVDQKIKIFKIGQKGKEIIGFVQDIYEDKSGRQKISVRPEICAPEIDFENEISLKSVTDAFGKNEIDIGDKIAYIL